MTITRRTVLKGLAWGGLAAPALVGGFPVMAAATPTVVRPTLVLVPSGEGGMAFVHGVRAAMGASSLVVRHARGDLSFLHEFEGLLRGGSTPRIIGLLDDAVSTPLIASVRGAGRDMPWLGQHSVGPGGVRHGCQATAETEECARQLGDAKSGQGDAWATALGYLIGGLGLPALAGKLSPSPPGSPLLGSFVSFLIKA